MCDGPQGSGQDDRQLVAHTQVHAVDLGDKQGRHSLIQRRAVHVDSRPERKNEARNFPGNADIFFGTFHGDREGGGTGAGGEGDQLSRVDSFPEFEIVVFAA